MTRAVNEAGLALTKASEGLRLKSYLCPAHKLTVGYGHTGPDVMDGMTIDEARADELLAADLAHAGDAVTKAVTVDLNDNQYAALCDFVFNLGAGAFQGSTLLKKLNAGDYAGASDEFPKWDKATVDGVKKALPGLTKRRAAERTLFLTAEA
ncbi:lysozyme [Paramagnetospirillum magneticum]|uniref:Lysozyme n=1 Tax=Paramagnetospirillum magneticum (strain ATCC 700264 / AMB-1) TaxID=342108 RepID=Q2W035_PARM1|nr:lysozyme [Paramagnetospirillum magneticum]BAE52790.1 Phage-related lysozyme [Paramagnetospirillum magneticum AMB-1]